MTEGFPDVLHITVNGWIRTASTVYLLVTAVAESVCGCANVNSLSFSVV